MKEQPVIRDLRYFGYLLTLVFVLAKLTGYFSHSWWLVFAPIWIPYALALAVLLVAGVLALAGKGVTKVRGGR